MKKLPVVAAVFYICCSGNAVKLIDVYPTAALRPQPEHRRQYYDEAKTGGAQRNPSFARVSF